MLTKMPVMPPFTNSVMVDFVLKAEVIRFDATEYLRLIARAEGRLTT